MMTLRLRSILETIIHFTEDELNTIDSYFEQISLKKNEVLINEGQSCSTFFLVESGCLRNYYNNNGLDINLSFTLEDLFTTSFEAYVNREPSRIIIQALENSVVWIVNARSFPRDNDSSPAFSTFTRRVAIRVLFATEEHHNMIMMNTPADRYRYILEKKPELVKRIPLTHLASYIGIKRETLSRIRSNKY